MKSNEHVTGSLLHDGVLGTVRVPGFGYRRDIPVGVEGLFPSSRNESNRNVLLDPFSIYTPFLAIYRRMKWN